jgi:hypothetical protein
MLIDLHDFVYQVSIPWPILDHDQIDWLFGVSSVEDWLKTYVGPRYKYWAWVDSHSYNQLGVGFRWEQDQLLFVLRWK